MSRKITLNELPAPFKVKEARVDGIVRYDLDNAYPTRMERLIDGSVTAKSSAGMLKRFLIGNGFVNEALNLLPVGVDRYGRPTTLYSLLRQMSGSMSYNAGYWIRLQYDGNLDVSGLRYEKFKECRFGMMDSKDNAGKVVLYKNWDKQRGTYRKTDWNRVDVYNPNEEAIMAQIQAVGDLEKWKGQVYWWFDDDDYIYPVSPVDPVIYDADTEKQISIYKNGELRTGFNLKQIIHHTAFDNKDDAEEFKEGINKLTGAGHEYSSMVLEGSFDEKGDLKKDGPNVKIEPIAKNTNNKTFDSFEKSTINNIRKAFHAIPQILIDYEDGKLGTTSGEALKQASAFYNTQIIDLQNSLSKSFFEIMRNWKDDMSGETFKIKPLSLGTPVDI